MDNNLLEKIDIIRERLGVTYMEARKALEETDGNVVDALVLLEGNFREERAARQEQWESIPEDFMVKGSELIEFVQSLLHEGNVTKIRVLHKGETLFELPLTAGVVTVLILPQLVVLAGIAALFTQVTIQVERPERTQVNPECSENCCEDCSEENCS